MAGVVLVHGAWHGAWCWDPVAEELQRRGVTVEAVELPLTGFADDVRTARDATRAMGPDTILVGHSYAGLVISEAAIGLPSVRHLVYLAALMCEEGEDSTAILAECGSPLIAAVMVTETGVTVDPARARELFYGDSDEERAEELIAKFRPMPLEPMTQISEPAWKSIPSTYVVCTNDRAIPPEAQRRMASRAGEVVEIHTDHSPFVTRPEFVADVVVTHLPDPAR
jgi:pimeloyl-ACP methyl ester carboxylesterase